MHLRKVEQVCEESFALRGPLASIFQCRSRLVFMLTVAAQGGRNTHHTLPCLAILYFTCFHLSSLRRGVVFKLAFLATIFIVHLCLFRNPVHYSITWLYFSFWEAIQTCNLWASTPWARNRSTQAATVWAMTIFPVSSNSSDPVRLCSVYILYLQSGVQRKRSVPPR